MIPAFLAGAWDTASAGDRGILARLAGEKEYDVYEAKIRGHRQLEDAPLESVDTVWAIRAPVDVFVHLANLLGTEHFLALEETVKEVFGQLDPALGLAIEKRPFAKLHGATFPHSAWLREGLANTLLVIAAHGEKSSVVVNGATPQQFINTIIAGIPALRDDVRVLSSLSNELPLLMEAAPDPLLFALEQLLEGDGQRLLPIFQDAKDQPTFFTRSPHTGILWALEMIAWDPTYLPRAALILLKMSEIDPGGALANRPLRSLRQIFLAWHPDTNAPLRLRLAVLDQLIAEHEPTAWDLLVSLLPKGYDVADQSAKPRYREAGASDREVITYGLRDEAYREIIHRTIAQAGVSAGRWETLFEALHAFPIGAQELAISEFESRADQLNENEKISISKRLADIIRHHTAFAHADWSLRKDVIDRLEAILERLKPDDPIYEVLWLFEERFPTIDYKNADEFLAEVDRLRGDAVLQVLNERGIPGVLELANRSEASRFVGLAAGYVVRDIDQGMELASDAFRSDQKFDGFASLLSASLRERFGQEWSNSIRLGWDSNKLSPGQIVTLTLSWPHQKTTWDYVASFGEATETIYWQRKQAWGIQGDASDLARAVEQYLDAGRAEFIVTSLFNKTREIPGALLLQTLDEFENRIREEPAILQVQSLAFDLQQFFEVLRGRTDVTSEEVAIREYRYLPLLGPTWIYGPRAHSLELHNFMAESPEFFVKILCDVFSRASERGSEKAESLADVRARARIGWTLLDGFAIVPGLSEKQIDGAVLKNWVAEVRRIAGVEDRLVIGEQKIGTLLAHAPDDPDDNLWPHKTIRESLEDWKSDEIERGMLIGRINMRGVTARVLREGGKPERTIAGDLRSAAKQMILWPRTRKLLHDLAEHWDDVARREDIRASQDELRE